MAKYSLWHHKKRIGNPEQPVPGPLVNLGRKLLGRVAERKQNGDLGQITEQVTLPDGSKVRASMVGDQPTLEIEHDTTSGGTEQCTLYMESGLLDLGENQSSDATDQPQYLDDPKTLYFGETVDCDVFGGLNGDAVFGLETVSSQCLAGEEPSGMEAMCLEPVGDSGSFPEQCTRAEKIEAQGKAPAALFTGLMRRYVQALYGQPLARYKWNSAPSLDVPVADGDGTQALTWGWDGGTWGLIDLGGRNYRFAKVTDTGIDFYPIGLPDCGKLLLEVLRAGKVGKPGKPRFDRIESYLLSTMLPRAEATENITFTTPVTGEPIAYGWKFNARGNKIAVVTLTDEKFKVWRREIRRNTSGNIEVLEDDGDEETFGPADGHAGFVLGGRIIRPTDDLRSLEELPLDTDGPGLPDDWDCAVYCYYLALAEGEDPDDEVLEIVRSSRESISQPVVEDLNPCVDDGMSGTVTAPAPLFDPTCSTREELDGFIQSSGFYTDRWSSVSLGKVGLNADDEVKPYFEDKTVGWSDEVSAVTDTDSSSVVSDWGYSGSPSTHLPEAACSVINEFGDDPAARTFNDCDYESYSDPVVAGMRYDRPPDSDCAAEAASAGSVTYTLATVADVGSFTKDTEVDYRDYFTGWSHSQIVAANASVLYVPCGDAAAVIVMRRKIDSDTHRVQRYTYSHVISEVREDITVTTPPQFNCTWTSPSGSIYLDAVDTQLNGLGPDFLATEKRSSFGTYGATPQPGPFTNDTRDQVGGTEKLYALIATPHTFSDEEIADGSFLETTGSTITFTTDPSCAPGAGDLLDFDDDPILRCLTEGAPEATYAEEAIAPGGFTLDRGPLTFRGSAGGAIARLDDLVEFRNFEVNAAIDVDNAYFNVQSPSWVGWA